MRIIVREFKKNWRSAEVSHPTSATPKGRTTNFRFNFPFQWNRLI